MVMEAAIFSVSREQLVVVDPSNLILKATARFETQFDCLDGISVGRKLPDVSRAAPALTLQQVHILSELACTGDAEFEGL